MKESWDCNEYKGLKKRMIDYKRYVLDNGLRVIIHQDKSTPMAILNLLYEVGARNEQRSKSGFAHLFEHLMFGGTTDVPDYDKEIELAAGENNAFTNSDITNFYDVLPANNIETAIWLEADRMQNLKINEKSLSIQKKVVVEEFYETSLNLPYGKAWHFILEMAYGTHPYSWPTIGLVPEHIKDAKLEDVQNFFDEFYHPSNAILVIAGNVDFSIIELVKKWFGDIPKSSIEKKSIPKAVIKSNFRTKTIVKQVPSEIIYMAFGMCDRLSSHYYATDLLSDILANGKSSRLYQNLVKDNQIFGHIDAYVTGNQGEGLFVIEGQLMDGIELDFAQDMIQKELALLKIDLIEEVELQKLKNKIESNLVYSHLSISNKSYNLAYYESLGDISLINKEKEYYASVSREEIRDAAKRLFVTDNTIVLKYQKEK